MPNARIAGSTSTSARRASSEYSTWALLIGVRPGNARCQVAAWAVCQPTKLETPAYRAMPDVTAWSTALNDSSNGALPQA